MGRRLSSRDSTFMTPGDRLAKFKGNVAKANASFLEQSKALTQKVQDRLAKRQMRLQNAQSLLQVLKEESGVNDANILFGQYDGAEPGVGSLTMTNQTYIKDEGAEVPTAKKDFRYKLKSFKRRTEQRLLERMGKSPQRKLKETEFDVMWDKVATQERVWRDLTRKTNELMNTMETLSRLSSEIAEDLVEIGKDQDEEADDYQANALPLLKLQYSLDTISRETTPTVLASQMKVSVSEPLELWSDEFPCYQACLAKRQGLARDVDAYERKLTSLEEKAIDKREPADIAKRKDQLTRAEKRFKSFNHILLKHFKSVDAEKYEKGQAIGEGVLEALRFWFEKCADILPPPHTFQSKSPAEKTAYVNTPFGLSAATPASVMETNEEEEEEEEEEEVLPSAPMPVSTQASLDSSVDL